MKKSGSWYTYDGEQLGQGKENARNFLLKNPDVAAGDRDEDQAEARHRREAVEAGAALSVADELAERRPA